MMRIEKGVFFYLAINELIVGLTNVEQFVKKRTIHGQAILIL